MTPDIHTKTYAERSVHFNGIGGLPSNVTMGNAMLHSGVNDSGIEAELHAQIGKMSGINSRTPQGGNVDFDNGGEDLIMMNIPREGNAD